MADMDVKGADMDAKLTDDTDNVTVRILETDEGQILRFPKRFHVKSKELLIFREDDKIVLGPA
ncbi:MAG: hypothetical protein LBR80_05630 [Deltaproteobacteria bacterium]|jgi:hypothetical protein|nr:hypothetical protein [Deltaproteobacteria bacterium]